MSNEKEPQRELTRVALDALHGIIDRPTQDIDLFTSDMDVDAF